MSFTRIRTVHLFSSLFIVAFLLSLVSANSVENSDGTTTHHLHFKILFANVTRFCNETKQILTVNGEFPGPNVYVRQGDQVNIKVSNRVNENVSIHWHGVRQMLTNWADGPAYITQCPLMPKKHYTHSFKIYREQGSLFWHAHIGWQRATVYGAFIILPPKSKPFPFPLQPKADFPLLLGEWWNMDVNDVERFGLASGVGYNISDALTINGQPGFLYDSDNCSARDAVALRVKKGETYLLRIINAAMNFQLYFQIANHKLILVETDCMLAKPYTTDVILLAPGQTADVLVTADQEVGTYAMAASVYSPPNREMVPYPTVATTGLFIYDDAETIHPADLEIPSFPQYNDTDFALQYLLSLRSLNNEQHPENVPQTVDEDLLFTVGYSIIDCPDGETCSGPGGGKVETSVSNVTFELPTMAILQAYYELLHANDSSHGVALPWETTLSAAEDSYQEDFPSVPLFQYNYTAPTPDGWNLRALHATKAKLLDLDLNVQLVLQNTRNLFFESHPFHLHGYNFFVVGAGLGTYDPHTHPASFNLVDPPAMNTVAVPSGGWVALRFYTDNPGVWLMHCHFEMHTSWGMMMVFIVKDGPTAKLPPPPKDYPKC